MNTGVHASKQSVDDSPTICSSQSTQSVPTQVPNSMAHGPFSPGNEISADRPSIIHPNPVSSGPLLPLRRKRAKHGPEARIAPLDENPITQALKSHNSRQGEPIFLPVVGMEFNSAEDAKDFYNFYSWEIGLGIRKGRNSVNGNNYMTRQDLVCSCEGLSPNSSASSYRSGCKAMIRLHRSSDHGWVISRVVTKHNHPLSATYGENKQWPSHSETDSTTKDFVQKLRENNIPIGRVCSILGVNDSKTVQPIRKEVPSGNIMPRWMKNDPEPEASICSTRRSNISGTSLNELKKRALLNHVMQVAYGTDEISDEAFTQVMAAVDSLLVRPANSSAAALQSTITAHNTNYKQSVAGPSMSMPKSNSTIRCPDRPIKNGRPPHSSLKSWKDQQKRARCVSTDEENPTGGKTRRIVDVLEFK